MRFSPAYRFKSADLTRKGEFRGVASAFGGPPDCYGHIIEPGAFDYSLKKHAELGTMPAMLWAHDQAEPIGTWLTVEENDQALVVHGRLTLATRRGAEAYALMRDGGLTGLSVGILLDESGGAVDCDDQQCVIKRVERLAEISLVPVPANERAQITNVKSACGCHSVPELQKYFQDSLGVSRSKARKMAFACSGILSGNDSEIDEDLEPAEIETVAKQLKGLTALFEKQTPFSY